MVGGVQVTKGNVLEKISFLSFQHKVNGSAVLHASIMKPYLRHLWELAPVMATFRISLFSTGETAQWVKHKQYSHEDRVWMP